MVATEQYFPRGGKKPKVSLNEKKKYDFLGNSDKIGKKKKYRPKIIPKDVEKDLDYLSDTSYDDNDDKIKALSAEKLSSKTLQEGMVLLGRISSITDTKLTVTLPSRLYGYVMASHISLPYTKLLQSYVDDKIENIKTLEEIFKIGEYVSVKVISVTFKDDKIIPTFSLMPQDVNMGTLFSNVHEGDIIRGAVESVEDHGYILDLGIPNCRTFLPSKWIEKTFPLDIGQVIWCTVKKCVKSTNNTIITVTNKINIVNTSCISGDRIQKYSVTDLKPGMAVDFYVNKPLNDGAEGYVLSNCVGYVHTSQIESRLLVGKKVKAYLLYVMPITKLPFFTTRPIFETYFPDMASEMPYKEGEIIENAKVSKYSNSNIILKNEKIIFIIPKKLSQYKEDENFTQHYETGSKHIIRIVSYCMSDYVYVCSDELKFLEQKYFSYHDFSVGELVEGTVKMISERGILVDINHLKGWIPNVHMSDVGLNWLTKSGSKNVNVISKKFKVGEKVLTRVLIVDPNKSQLHLTVKPTYLEPEFAILSSFEDAKVNFQYKGMVETVFKNGILVSFFNRVCAFIHRSKLSHEKVNSIQDIVNIGQIVNCTVISVNLEEKKMVCSLIDCVDQNNTEQIEHVEKKEKKRVKQTPVECSENVDIENDALEYLKSKRKERKRKANEMDVSEKYFPDDKCDEEIKTNSEKNKKTKKNEVTENESTEGVLPTIKLNKKKNNIITNDFNVTEVIDYIDNANNKISKKKKKSKKEKTSTLDSKDELISENTFEKKENSSKNKSSIKSEIQFSSMANFWNLEASTISKNISQNVADSSSSETDEVVMNFNNKKKRLTKSEKIQKARDEEEKLRQIEKELMEVSDQPKSSDHFDRLLLANPNNSELWIAYMAFHLQATEVDRARAVAKKAINVISFREEHEKMNIWLALLNLENRFGTKESLNSTLKDAVQMNDSFKIHSKMLDMYVEIGKINELTSLVDTMLAKYKDNPDTYMYTGESCYKLNLVDKARSIMQKAVSRLDNKKHIPILVKFAQLENANGDMERAETIFEQILGCMPQRVDICGVYVDMLLKSEKFDNARFILERAVSQKLNSRKMKFLYKKWIELEEKFGDVNKLEKVKQMALEYVEKGIN